MSDEVKTDEGEEIGDTLTDKQRAFCIEYPKDFNATKAAIRAGYSAHYDSARNQGSELLADPRIRNIINRHLKLRKEEISDSITISIRPELKEAIKIMVGSEGIERFVEQIIIDNLDNDGLTQYIEKRARYISTESRYSVLAKAGFKCQACGAKPLPGNDVTLNIDHIIPFSMGGSSDESNLQVLCHECNISKGNRFAIDHRENKDE